MCSPVSAGNFLKTPGPAGTAGTDRHFNSLTGTSNLLQAGTCGDGANRDRLALIAGTSI